MDLYELVRGPLAWGALVIFVLGSLYRVVSLLLDPGGPVRTRQPSPSGSQLSSVLVWMIPFGSQTMRQNPALTLVSFFFHISVIVTPAFLLAHNVLWYESWNVQWCSLSEGLADILTVLIIAACGYFVVRRITIPEVREVSKPSDFVLLAIVALPFLFGFLAYHEWGPYRPLLILHILSGEIMLVAIPFTRLSHMLSFAFSRADVGSEFGEAVNSRQW